MTHARAFQIEVFCKFGLGESRRAKNVGKGAPLGARQAEFCRGCIKQLAQLARNFLDEKDDLSVP